MELAKKPEMVLSFAAVVIAGGGLFYMNNKINLLGQTLTNATNQIDAIGKVIGELRPKEIAESKETLAAMSERLRSLDQFVYAFKKDFEEIKKEIENFNVDQRSDNTVLENFINEMSKIIETNSQDSKVGTVELMNTEEVSKKKKKRKPSRAQVKFEEDDGDSDEDEVASKLERLRKQRSRR